MATYVIGDLQGCYEGLQGLLKQIRFDPDADRLWLAGDLVNRGPQSLEVLRFVKNLGDRAVAVLGNHDLHLLATAVGARNGRRDTLDAVMRAPDSDELLHWLRQRPLMHVSADGEYAMLHAGLPPQWTIAQARACASEVEAILGDERGNELLKFMYGNQPDIWREDLSGLARLRFILNCFTRLRYCTAEGRLDFDEKDAPGKQSKDLLPWFSVPGRRSADRTILFGHWSTLRQVEWPEYRVYGLDTGCVWGGKLTALRLEDHSLHAYACSAAAEIGGD